MTDQQDVVDKSVIVTANAPAKPMPQFIPGETQVKEQLAAIKEVVVKTNGPSPEDIDPIQKAKQLVVDNYNNHRNAARMPAMTPELVRVLWFTGSRGNFKAVCEFTIVYGIRYDVSYNARRDESFIDVYKKLTKRDTS